MTEQTSPRPSLQFTLGQVESLLEIFGDQNGTLTVEYFPARHWPDQPDAPAGLYAYSNDRPSEGALWLGEQDASKRIRPTWQHLPPDPIAQPMAFLDHAVHAYKVASIARMAMETAPDGVPTTAVLDASIREGVRAALAVCNMHPTSDLLLEVLAEIDRATAKFPTWPNDPLHAIGVLGEEFGELTKAVMQATYEPHKNGPGDVRNEAVQTAAMALRFLASLDRYEYAGSVQHHQAFASTP